MGIMRNAQKPFLMDKNRVSQLTNEEDLLDMFLRLQEQLEKEEEIMSEIEFGDNGSHDENSVGGQSTSDLGSMNDCTVYSTDDEMIREAINAENALRRWQGRHKNEETISTDVTVGEDGKDENDTQNDDSQAKLVKREVYRLDDFFDEIKENAEDGKGKGFLVSFHTDPTHPDRPRMQPPDVRLEMGGVGLDNVFISSSSSKKSEHFIIARILWSMGYTGGLPVDEYQLYRRLDTGGDLKQSTSSSSSVSSSSSTLASSADLFVTSASTSPWELISQSLESNHLEMLPVRMFHPLMEQQVQFHDECGIRSKNHNIKLTEQHQEENDKNADEEDVFSVEKIKEMELEGIRVVEIPRVRFVSKHDKNETIHPKKVPLIRLQYKVRARNRCGWGHFSKPITFIVKPQRDEFSIDSTSRHGLGSGLLVEVRERLRTLSRSGSRSRTFDGDGQAEADEIDYSDMLSRPPTAHTQDEHDEVESSVHGTNAGEGYIAEKGEEASEEEKAKKGEAAEEKEEDGEFDFEKFLERMAELTPYAKLTQTVYL